MINCFEQSRSGTNPGSGVVPASENENLNCVQNQRSTALHEKCVRSFLVLLFNATYFWVLACIVIVGDTLLTGLIIKYIPCGLLFILHDCLIHLHLLDTEIDWKMYMTQTKVFLSGEHNYSRITGPTGPLMYVCTFTLNRTQLTPLQDTPQATYKSINYFMKLRMLGKICAWRSTFTVPFT